VAVDLLAQPFAQRAELAAGELLFEVAELCTRAVPDLHRDDVSQLIRREVPEEATGPVHVLEHAVRVVRNIHAQGLFHALIPDLRQVADGDGSSQKLSFELEAQDDVKPVGHLVRVAADQPGPDGAHGADERVLVDAGQRLGEESLQLRVEPVPEPSAPPDEVLPGPALRLVDRARGSSA
jgi:hypothetical protein